VSCRFIQSINRVLHKVTLSNSTFELHVQDMEPLYVSYVIHSDRCHESVEVLAILDSLSLIEAVTQDSRLISFTLMLLILCVSITLHKYSSTWAYHCPKSNVIVP
jgi:hypothetical protein